MDALQQLDVSLFETLTMWRAPWLDTAMAALSDAGRRGFIWFVLAAVAALFPARRAGALRLVLAVSVAFLAVDGILKPVIGRDRPFVVLDNVQVISDRPTTSSLPSGHAASAFAGAVAAGRIWPLAQVPLLLVAALIAWSRVYVGVHFPFDVVAGAVVGVAAASLVLGGSPERGLRPAARRRP